MSEPSIAQHLRRRTTARQSAAKAAEPVAETVEQIDTSYLETLIGYNARRAALTVIASFLPRMAQFGLRPVEFSVLTLIGHNQGITSRQLCGALDILPPNLVGLIKHLEKLGVVEKREHPTDRRAQGLYLTEAGMQTLRQAEQTASELEIDATPRLTTAERKTLIRLLRKVYTPA